LFLNIIVICLCSGISTFVRTRAQKRDDDGECDINDCDIEYPVGLCTFSRVTEDVFIMAYVDAEEFHCAPFAANHSHVIYVFGYITRE